MTCPLYDAPLYDALYDGPLYDGSEKTRSYVLNEPSRSSSD